MRFRSALVHALILLRRRSWLHVPRDEGDRRRAEEDQAEEEKVDKSPLKNFYKQNLYGLQKKLQFQIHLLLDKFKFLNNLII